MVRARVVALALLSLGIACATPDQPPEAGPGGGPVDVRVSVEPSPGGMVVLDLSADGETHGSACVTIDRWEEGGWRARWWWVQSSSTGEPIAGGGTVTCPAIAVPLPMRMSVELPSDLPPGTWRVAYKAGEDLGAYVFEVL